MRSPRHSSFNTISHPPDPIHSYRRSQLQRYHYSSPSYQNQSIQYKNARPKQLERIARSFNVRTFQTFQRSTNLDQRKRSINLHKSKQKEDNYDRIRLAKKIQKQVPQNQSLSIDMLRGERYSSNPNSRFHRRSYVKAIVPVESSKSKRVVPIEFEEQLKQANRTFVKQNLHDWMKHKREDILNKVSEQIKLKSEFQKFLPN